MFLRVNMTMIILSYTWEKER